MLHCTPFLLFDGNCAEAMTFYHQGLGGELTLTKLGDTPMKAQFPPEKHKRIINAHLKSGALDISATDWMASPALEPIQGNMFGIFVIGATYDEQKALGSAMLPSSWLARWNVLHGAPSAHRFLHELADPGLFSGSQLLQREGDRPQGAFVEVRAVVEAQRRVPRLELVRGLEEADDLAVLGIRGHPVPELRREGWRAGFDDRMEPLAEGAIRCRQ